MKSEKNNIKYPCEFEEDVFINEKSANYKGRCDFNNRPDDEKPYKKFYDKHLFRYSLKCKIQEKGEPITVILMNPSYADECGLDSTLCNVKNFLKDQKIFSEFEVLNIFPIRTPDSSKLVELMKKYKKYQKANDEYIKKALNKSKKVLIAWGSKYHSHAKWIFEILKNKEVYTYCAKNKNGSPKHFVPQVYNRATKKLQKYEF